MKALRVLYYFEDEMFALKPKILTNTQFQAMKAKMQERTKRANPGFQEALQTALNSQAMKAK